MDELRRMLALVVDADPQMRRYALSQIERLADLPDDEEVLSVIRAATSDPVPWVAHQADRTLSILLSRTFASPSSGQVQAPGTPSAAQPGESEAIEPLRVLGASLTHALLERLQGFALCGDHELARRAVLALGKIGSADSVETLSKALRDPALAKAAAMALGRMRCAQAAGPLIEVSQFTDPTVRAYALAELGRVEDPRGSQRLLGEVTSPEPFVRASVAAALGESADTAGVLPALIHLAADAVFWVAMEALRGLGKHRDRSALSAVCDAFSRSRDPHLRASAVATLGRQGQTLALGLLRGALADTNERVRANAVEAIASIVVDPMERETLLSPMLADPNNRVRANACVALSDHHPDLVLATLEKMARSEDVWFRASAAYALARASSDRARQMFLSILAVDREPEVLQTALRALSRSPDPRANPSLAKLLEHPVPGIRIRAARVLGTIAGDEGVARLCERFLTEDDGAVRGSIAWAIGQRGQRQELNLLAEALAKDPDTRVQRAVVDVMADRGNTAALTSVRPLAFASDPWLKASAVIALFTLGEIDVVQNLRTMTESADPHQVRGAIFAAGELGRALRFLGTGVTNPHLVNTLRQQLLASSGVEARLSQGPVMIKPAGTPPASLERIEKVIATLLAAGKDQAAQVARRVSSPESAPMLGYLLSRTRPDAPGTEAVGETLLRDVAEREKDFVEPLMELGNLYIARGDKAMAADAYIKAYARRIEMLADQVETARHLSSRGLLHEALTVVQEMGRWMPLPLGSHRRLGRVLLRLRRVDRALRHLYLAHVENPWDMEVTYDYACAALLAGQHALAQALCAQVVRFAKPDDPIAPKARRMYTSFKETSA